jgi:glutamate--cysteine ligase
MARDTTDQTPLSSVQELTDYLAAGNKPTEKFRIGTEHEKFAFFRADNSPVPYAGDASISALLKGLQERSGWEPIMDGENIIGLGEQHGMGAISIEPGGQFELSGAPLETIHETCRESNQHLAVLREIAEPMGIRFLGIGGSPKWTLAETPVMPKSRYEIMTRYMPKVGKKGLDMMYRTCTIQVNLDFESEIDMRRKMQVSLKLQPLSTALFANSPFTDGRPNGFLSWRGDIWRDTDNQRSGLLEFCFSPEFGFADYVEWALDVPMYFIKRGDTYVDVSGQSFRDLLAGKLPGAPGERATISDWANHVSTIFPEVRLKRYLEMRGADAGPWRRLPSLTAYWIGLLYDDASLDACWDIVKDWSASERQRLREEVPKSGFKAEIGTTNTLTLARKTLDLARQGLERRKRLDRNGRDETRYLRPLEETVARGITPAEELLNEYDGMWGGTVDPIYDEYAY